MPMLTSINPLAVALGAALAAGASIAQADQNPFSIQPLAHGYTVAANSAGSGDEATSPDDETDDKAGSSEGKCGEGKCGAGSDENSDPPSGDADAAEGDDTPPPPSK